jgi:hypothetical protein
MTDLLQGLAAANPVSESRRPPIEDVWRKVALAPDPASRRASRRHSRRWAARRWSAAAATAATAAAAVALVLIAFLSGSTPNRAQAFPVLGEHAALTPASLQRALDIYGVGPGHAGLNIRQGPPVHLGHRIRADQPRPQHRLRGGARLGLPKLGGKLRENRDRHARRDDHLRILLRQETQHSPVPDPAARGRDRDRSTPRPAPLHDRATQRRPGTRHTPPDRHHHPHRKPPTRHRPHSQ